MMRTPEESCTPRFLVMFLPLMIETMSTAAGRQLAPNA